MLFSSALATVLGLLASPVFAANCTNPSVRREWRTFTTEEKSEWISAVKCLSDLPHNPDLFATVPPSVSSIVPINASGSYYDDFVYVHMDLNTRIHFTGLFLPWHRWYVTVYETALQQKCNYTGVSPYWNWSMDATEFFESPFWSDSDPSSGLGGWGDPSKDYEVQDGAFSTFNLSYPSYHTLRRNFTAQPYLGLAGLDLFPEPALYANTTFTIEKISEGINGFVGDYPKFQQWMEWGEGPHGSVHLIMGGDLGGSCPASAPANCTPGPTFSANEPLFWMHHAMVDKVWYDWQHANESNFWAYVGGANQSFINASFYDEYPSGAAPMLDLDYLMPSDGMFEQATIRDVMNTTDGLLCYIYE
ncbi:Di-copper centre-containing protein [Vararia minispora EC-137]|uniref:Di-copper centre-containing protein n=1 Tax=Vararia minispora EC-137 TaxID=1314806 RepID=A0ACB8QEM8_9AGAM|nr:Di-copper centre-containing protein [Vararia minispora EC-137]